MSDQYMRDLMRVAVAQICQTIGYNATQTTPLELLQDTLHKFMHEFARDLRRQTEHYNRTDANLNDTCLALNSLNINVSELLDYINNVEPVPFIIEVPKFPAYKDSNLNFLKPGSKEVLTRPVHIFEHLPPILPPDEAINISSNVPQYLINGCNSEDNKQLAASMQSALIGGGVDGVTQEDMQKLSSVPQKSGELNTGGAFLFPNKQSGVTGKEGAGGGSMPPFLKTSSSGTSHILDDEGRATREIISVVMTTGGFISPAIEGKLPDALIPDLIEKLQGLDAPPPSPRPVSRTSAAPENTAAPNTSSANKQQPTELEAASTAPSTSAQAKTIENILVKKSTATESVAAVSSGNLGFSSSANSNSENFANTNATTLTTSPTNKLTPSPHTTGGTTSVAAHLPETPPTTSSKFLKKTKKKQSPTSQFATMQTKLGRLGYHGRLDADSMGAFSLSHLDGNNDKAQRKAMKMLQKLNKSSKSAAGGDGLGMGGGKFKGLLNPAMVASLPPGPERFQMEKLLKKQTKHKQKLLKQQMALEFQNRSFTDMMAYPANPADSFFPNKSVGPHAVKDVPALQTTNFKSSSVVNAQAELSMSSPSSAKPSMYPSPLFSANMDTLQVGRGTIKPSGIFAHNTDIDAELHPQPESHEKRTSFEMKLSNEPDRSKLNIFKKISSKQKSLKATSPRMQSTTISASGDGSGPVINLPSGTTITPAPPVATTHGRNVYPPEASDEILDKLSDHRVGSITPSSMSLVSMSASSPFVAEGIPKTLSDISIFGTMDTDNLSLINKPKKRGRKPGSKNHAKAIATGATLSPNGGSLSPLKKAKKLKLDKGNLYGQSLPSMAGMQSSTTDQPLNLTNQFGSGANELGPSFEMSMTKSFAMQEKSATMFNVQTKDRKERKKLKLKNSSSPAVSSLEPSPNSKPHLSAVPTKEEVNSINKKLMRMDTVLKAAPPIISTAATNISDSPKLLSSPKDHQMHSPTKSTTKSPGSLKKQQQRASQQQEPQQRRSSPANSSLLSANLAAASFMPTGTGTVGGFANLQANMLSMLPMYPFTSRPGLIPSPGLFPTAGLGVGFPNNPANVAGSNMLLSGFLPFPKLKSVATTGKISLKDVDTTDNFVEPIPQPGERSYCNVAPLVPESMKFSTPPDAKTDRSGQSLLSSSSSGNSHERDYPKTPKVHHQSSKMSHDGFSDSGLLKKQDSSNTPDSSSISMGSKSIPPTPGGISLNTYEALTRKSSSSHGSETLPTTPSGSSLDGSLNLSQSHLTPENNKSALNIFAQNTSLNENKAATTSTGMTVRTTTMGKTSTTSVLNADDPIEVSDDSLDSTPKTPLLSNIPLHTTSSTAAKLKMGGPSNFIKPPLMSTPFMPSNMDDIFTPNTNMSMTSTENDFSIAKDAKRLKKSSKFVKNKNNSFNSPAMSTMTGGMGAVPLDVFSSVSGGGTEKVSGVGKLAGGADLIPLAGTGLAYSSKTIPATSLTAVAAPSSSSFSTHKRDFGQANIFDNLTITPAVPPASSSHLELQKKQRNKEHKKFKKIKEGKIKKKKDKKVKSKSKERAEKYLKTDKALKESDSVLDKSTKDKDMLKKLKKEKKKEKQRMILDSLSNTPATLTINKPSGGGGSVAFPSAVAVYDAAAVCGVSASENISPVSSSLPQSTASPSSSSSLSYTPAAASVSTTTGLTNTVSLVPKLTLKLGSCQSPTPLDNSLVNLSQSTTTTTSTPSSAERERRELSPELARISPLVTRPPKLKFNSNDTSSATALGTSSSAGGGNSLFEVITDNSRTPSISSSNANISAHSLVPPPSPWLSGGTLTASSVLLPQQLLQITKAGTHEHTPLATSTSNNTTNPTESNISSAVKSTSDTHSPVPLISETSRPSSYIDAEGNRVWICPACGKVDDGSAMIGCDGCDAWYHWVCVGIFVAPKDNEDWFCRVCITRKKGIHGTDKKRKRNKKK